MEEQIGFHSKTIALSYCRCCKSDNFRKNPHESNVTTLIDAKWQLNKVLGP